MRRGALWRFTGLFGILVLTMVSGPPVFAEMLAVKVPVANIRSGPETNADILWKVEQYHPLNIIEKKGKWYRFKDFEGDEGWIYSSLLADLSTVIAVKENCNVRSGPGTGHDVVFTVEKGIPFKVIRKQGAWLEVVHADGDKGWIHGNLVWPGK